MDYPLTGPSLGEEARVRLEETATHMPTRLGEHGLLNMHKQARLVDVQSACDTRPYSTSRRTVDSTGRRHDAHANYTPRRCRITGLSGWTCNLHVILQADWMKQDHAGIIRVIVILCQTYTSMDRLDGKRTRRLKTTSCYLQRRVQPYKYKLLT